MAEAAIISGVLQAGQQVVGKAADFYNQADEATKAKIAKGAQLAQVGGQYASGIGRALIFAAINFFILAVIFVSTLIAKNKALFRAGDKAQENYIKNSFLKGLGLALVAAAVFFFVDIFSGGIATIVMFIIYPLAGIATLVLSLIAPSFLIDISETKADVKVTRISGYRLWSVAFWILFVIGMIVALAIGGLLTYIGTRFTRVALDALGKVAGTNGSGSGGSGLLSGLGSSLGSLLSKV